jgi:hypothetical protein
VIPFYTHFPDLAARETRTITLHGRGDIPDGEYGLVEFYCDEPDCDCRRVIFRVVSAPPHSRVWATINYGWESPEFYAQWVGDVKTGAEMAGACLEPFGPQSQYSQSILELVRWVLLDETYVRRLQEHYRLFKEAVAARQEARDNRSPRRRASPKRRK